MRIKFFALIVFCWGVFVAVRWMQLHSHLHLHLDYDLHRLGDSFYHHNNNHNDDGSSGQKAGTGARMESSSISPSSSRVASGRGSGMRGVDDDDNNNNSKLTMMKNKALEMGGQDTTESSGGGSGSATSEDEDAVDISEISGSSSGSGSNNNGDDSGKNGNGVTISATTWAAEVLEAVRLINEGEATFKDVQTRFETFAKAGNKLTKISMSDVFASLKRQARGKRFDVDVAREKLDAHMKSKGDRGLTADVAKDVVLRHLAHEMHAAIVSARVNTRPLQRRSINPIPSLYLLLASWKSSRERLKIDRTQRRAQSTEPSRS